MNRAADDLPSTSRGESESVMKRVLIVLAAGFLLSFAHPGHIWAFGTKDVVQLSQEGIPDSLIVEKIWHSGTRFHLDAKEIHDLTQAGVSNDVIVEMLRTEDLGGRGDGVIVSPWAPYYAPWYLGLDF